MSKNEIEAANRIPNSNFIYFSEFLLRNCRESCKREQLSYSNLLSAQKRVSTKIVNEICQSNIERSTSKPNGTYRQPIHGCFHKPKNMFNPTTNFGFSAVVFFLFFGQGGCCDNLFHKFHFGRVWGVFFLHKHCRHNLLYLQQN